MTKILSKFGQQQLVMVNYACGLNQSEMGKYFEWIIINNYWMRLSMISWIIKTEVCVICRSRRLRQITQTRGFDHSWYHAKTEFNNCFIIHSSHTYPYKDALVNVFDPDKLCSWSLARSCGCHWQQFIAYHAFLKIFSDFDGRSLAWDSRLRLHLTFCSYFSDL